jgi:hypothetical protein
VTEVARPANRAGRPATGVDRGRARPAGLGLEVNVDYLAACVLDLPEPNGNWRTAVETFAAAAGRGSERSR